MSLYEMGEGSVIHIMKGNGAYPAGRFRAGDKNHDASLVSNKGLNIILLVSMLGNR